MSERISVDIAEMIKLIGESLYTTPDIVFRELIQNCYDSIYQRYGSDTPTKGSIQVHTHTAPLSVEFKDNGSGMDKNELKEYLSTMGQGIKKAHSSLYERSQTIGEFGIGFFCSFMICDQIIVITKKQDESNGWRWISRGLDKYDIEELKNIDEPRGTIVRLLLQRGLSKYTVSAEVQKIIKRYCNYLDCPIFLNQKKKPINTGKLAWELKKPTDQKRWVEKHLNTPSLYFKTGFKNTGKINFSYVLSLSDVDDSYHQIYCRRMFVTGRLDFIPTYLNLIDVVLNCDDLDLDMSREQIKQNATFEVLITALEELSLNWIKKLIKSHRQEPEFVKIIKKHQDIFSSLALKDPVMLDRLYPCLLFRLTNHEDGVTIDEYIDRISIDKQTVLYVSMNESRGQTSEKERLLLLVCEERQIPVIMNESDKNAELLRKVCNKKGLLLKRLGECMDLLVNTKNNESTLLESVRTNFERFFPVRCRVESFPPPSLPMVIEAEEIVLNENNRYLLKLSELNIKIERLRLVYLNLHKIVRELDKSKLKRNILESIIKTMIGAFENWGEHLKQWGEDEQKLSFLSDRWWSGQRSIAAVQMTPREFRRHGKTFDLHCFIACPFSGSYRDVVNIAKEVCASYQIYAETAEEIDSRDILEKVCLKVDSCDFAIVDISENNPNVLLELGLLMARRKPAIITRDKNMEALAGIRVPVDIIGIERIEYENTSEDLREKLQSACQQIRGNIDA